MSRKSRSSSNEFAAWAIASEELGIELAPDASSLGPVVRGRVNDHVVAIAPAIAKGRKKRTFTKYRVKYEATEAPKFTLTKRVDETTIPKLDTGNPKFDAVVAVETEQPALFSRYLTGPRRAAILRILTYWPNAKITNREANFATPGIEDDTERLVDSICHLVATAETFDRVTPPLVTAPVMADAATPPPVAAPPSGFTPAPPSEMPTPDPTAQEVDEADLLTEVRLDEQTVLHDLFNTGLSGDAVAARFAQVYQGRDVTWSGEVLRVGTSDRGGQRIAVLIGSANGQDVASGRVVALTAVAAQPVLTEGSVVTFSGSLANLDHTQRLFHVI